MYHGSFTFYSIMGFLLVATYVRALEVKVSPTQPNFAKTEDVNIILQYNNTGLKALFIYPWYLPSTELEEPIFEVTCNGTPAKYVGKLMKRRAAALNSAVILLPGKIKKTTINLSSVYNMVETCIYKIEFNVDMDHLLFTGSNTARAGDTSVNDVSELILAPAYISVLVEGRLNTLVEQRSKTVQLSRASPVTYVNCSLDQSSAIAASFNAAASYATNALSYLTTTRPSGTKRYVTWFGKYSSTNWNKAKANYGNISATFSNKAFTFDCSCTESGVYAYVYPTWPYAIYLCGSFWWASTTGTDSQAGTIIHETTHFTVVIDTDDLASGQTSCKNLAISSPTKTLKNADTYEYFAENNPLLA